MNTLDFGWDQIMKHMRPGSRLYIVLLCKSGRHRSVAAALIAAHLFEATAGLPRPRETNHLCATWWGRLCPPECKTCQRPSSIRDEALHQARTMWAEVLARKKK